MAQSHDLTTPRDPSEPAQPSATHTPPVSVTVEAVGATSQGLKRERNEDQFLIATLRRSIDVESTSLGVDLGPALPGQPDGTILVVADGMGGQGGGDRASAVAVKAVIDYLCSAMPWFTVPVPQGRERQESLPGVREGLTSAMLRGDDQVRAAAAEGSGPPGMGTTLTLAFVAFPHLYVAHVGDSRCYILRAGRLWRLTTDHTVAEQLRANNVQLDKSSPFHHVLWNALGGGGKQARPRPDVMRCTLDVHDTIVLCSDGLTKHVDETQIAALLGGAPDIAAASVALVRAANEAGGSDNITVVVARLSTGN